MRTHLSVCAHPGCPELTDQTRCPAHTRAQRATKETNRPSTTARGYGTTHQHTKARWQQIMHQHPVRCASGPGCKHAVRGLAPVLSPDQPWDLGHTPSRDGYIGPQHPECNRATKRASGPVGHHH